MQFGTSSNKQKELKGSRFKFAKRIKRFEFAKIIKRYRNLFEDADAKRTILKGTRSKMRIIFIGMYSKMRKKHYI